MLATLLVISPQKKLRNLRFHQRLWKYLNKHMKLITMSSQRLKKCLNMAMMKLMKLMGLVIIRLILGLNY